MLCCVMFIREGGYICTYIGVLRNLYAIWIGLLFTRSGIYIYLTLLRGCNMEHELLFPRTY